MHERSKSTRESSVRWSFLAVLAALAFVAFVRIRLADIPLERDEGEYAYAGQLILQGIPPYALGYNMKFPGTYYAYALILAIFGQTPRAIHVGLLIVNAATILLVFGIGRRLLGHRAGAVAAVSFAVLSIDRSVLGVFAHATHFLILAVLAGLLVLLRAIEKRSVWAFLGSGVLFGVAVLMKQHAIAFLPLAAALVVWSEESKEARGLRAKAYPLGALSVGALLPMVVIVLILLAQGALGRFWLWTFRYASAYVTEIPVSAAWSFFTEGFERAATTNLALWVLGMLGALGLWIARWDRRTRIFLTGLLLASALAVCPGFYFRGHYFIVILPAISLLVGVAIASLRHGLERALSPTVAGVAASAVFLAAIGIYATNEREYLFSMTTRALCRDRFETNPFLEAVEIAKYVRDRTGKDERIAVMGSEPEIYFYADRKAATGYMYTYALLESQPFAAAMQDEMIREIEAAHPRYLIFSLIRGSWLPQSGSDQAILTWGRKYVRQCYDPVGVADVFSKDESHIVWGDAVKDYVAQSADLVYTFRRKNDDPCAVAR